MAKVGAVALLFGAFLLGKNVARLPSDLPMEHGRAFQSSYRGEFGSIRDSLQNVAFACLAR